MNKNIYSNLEINYEKNLNYIYNNYSNLYQNIIDADISHLGIESTPFGINIHSNNNMIYPQNVDAAINLQVNTFISNPTSLYKKPCVHNQKSKGADLHKKILADIEAQSPYFKQGWKEYSLNPNTDSYPILVMAGIGSGQHIEQLLEKKDIKHLIIVDQDFSFFKLSMHLIDWEKIDKYFKRDGYKIDFYISNTMDKLSHTILNDMFASFPYMAYYIPYYTHYQSKFFDGIKKHFLDKVQLMYEGLGFIDDELNSLNKTLTNLKHNIPVYTGGINIPEDSTLFIVASGPSLDNDIEYIKKFKDNAVIFSCGTALRVLEKNGIVPDFHFEIEREEEIHDVLTTHTSKEFRDKVSLIGLNVLYDKVFTDDFKESYLYFRAFDSGSSIIPDNIPKLFNTNPTVTNGAVSFACEFKWDKIYLFGADMGFKDIKNHHSKDAFHYIGDEDGQKWHNAHTARKITNTVKSNFDNKEMFSTSLFFWAKQSISNGLLDKQVTMYNCSDGAKIDYTIPFHADQIETQSRSKLNAVNLIKSNFKNLNTDKNKFKEKSVKEIKLYHMMIDEINEILTKNTDVNSFSDIFYILNKSFSIFQLEKNHDKNHNKSMGTTLLRGTIASVYATIYTHSLATHSLADATTFANKSFKLLADYLLALKHKV